MLSKSIKKIHYFAQLSKMNRRLASFEQQLNSPPPLESSFGQTCLSICFPNKPFLYLSTETCFFLFKADLSGDINREI